MSSFLNQKKLARGLRNNNPGNLIKTSIDWQGKIPNGTDAKFEQFVTVEFGLRAMALDLVNDIRKGKKTITKLINEYAPKVENDTNSYISSVAKSVGIGANDVIEVVNAKFLSVLIRAILKVELGKQHEHVTDTMIQSALRKVPFSNSNDVKVDTSDANGSFGILAALAIAGLLFFSQHLILI